VFILLFISSDYHFGINTITTRYQSGSEAVDRRMTHNIMTTRYQSGSEAVDRRTTDNAMTIRYQSGN
jgi:hypothetical protein